MGGDRNDVDEGGDNNDVGEGGDNVDEGGDNIMMWVMIGW